LTNSVLYLRNAFPGLFVELTTVNSDRSVEVDGQRLTVSGTRTFLNAGRGLTNSCLLAA
jgi:hypothetical protein